MKITFLELRRAPGRLIEALERREEVTISRRGRDIARVIPTDQPLPSTTVEEHPAFGIWADHGEADDPAGAVRRMRAGRFHDL